MTIKIPRVIHDEFIYEHNGLPDDDYRSKMKALGEELHEELEERLHGGKSQAEIYASCPRIVRGISPTHRYPQLKEMPRAIDVKHIRRFQTVAYGFAETKITAHLPDDLGVLMAKWREAFRRVAQTDFLILKADVARCGRPLTLSDLETYLTDNQQEPVKQKPFWMQLQDNQQKRQRGSRGKTKRSK
ncbi:hypothetical protein [Pseudomonas phage UF_RH7]|nr:hypothetical protein [Pseudomonas phage UF_RH7]